MGATTDLLVRVKGDTSDANSKLGKLGGSVGKLGKLAAVAAVGATTAVAALGAKSVFEFAGFQKSMQEVFTLLPGMSQNAMGAMTDDVLALSKQMGVLPDTVIPALYQAISAGVPPDSVFDFMETATKASIGGVTDLETAVDGITSTVNAYGASNITAADASDLMFTAVRLGKTTMDELSRSLFQVNPIAAGLGIQFGDVTASLAALTSQGVPTSVAATQIRQALSEMGKEGTTASDMFKELSGQTFTEFIAGGGDMKQAFDLMKGGADDMGVGVSDLFGSVEAGMAVLALTSDSGSVAFGNAMESMQDSAGATDQAFATMDQGLSRSWDKIKAQGAAAFIQLGAAIAPVVEKMLDWFVDKLPTAIAWVQKTWNDWKPTIDKIVAWLGVAIPQAVETMMTVWNTVYPIIAEIWGNIAEAISTVVSWFASDEGQGQVGSTIDTITSYFQGFLEFAGPLWDKISAIITTAMELITVIVDLTVRGIKALWENHGEAILAFIKVTFYAIRDVISGVMDIITGIMDVVLGILTGDWSRAWDGIKAIVDGASSVMRGIVDYMMANIKLTIRLALDLIGNLFGMAWNGIKTGAATGFAHIKSAIAAAMSGMYTTVVRWLDNINNRFVAIIRGIPGAIAGFVGTLGSMGWQLGRSLLDGIVSGLGGIASALGDKLRSGIGTAVSNVKSWFGIRSPSKVMEDQIGKPLAEGITGPASKAMRWTNNLATPGGTAAPAGGSGPITVIVKLGEDELARVITDRVRRNLLTIDMDNAGLGFT